MAAGLHPSLGVFHRNSQNPMGLVDDVMEAFSRFVDLAALRLVRLLVMFGLSVKTKPQRKKTMIFRKLLLDPDFETTQFSVYLRCCGSREQSGAALDLGSSRNPEAPRIDGRPSWGSFFLIESTGGVRGGSSFPRPCRLKIP